MKKNQMRWAHQMTPPKDMSEREKFEEALNKSFDNSFPYTREEIALFGLSYGLKLAAELVKKQTLEMIITKPIDILELEGEFNQGESK